MSMMERTRFFFTSHSWALPAAIAVVLATCFGMPGVLVIADTSSTTKEKCCARRVTKDSAGDAARRDAVDDEDDEDDTAFSAAGSEERSGQAPRGLGLESTPREASSSGGWLGGTSLGRFASRLFGSTDEDTTLPQDPKADRSSRLKQLADARKDYRWSTEGVPVGIPYLEGFPPGDELPRVSWITKTVAAVLRIVLGAVRGTVGAGEVVEALSDPKRAKTFARRIGELIKDAKVNERPVDIGDYEDLHAFPMKTPAAVHDYEEDDAFARQRLQGANCVVIEKCTEATRMKLKILDSDPSYQGLKHRVDALMKAGKLFVVDHELLKGMEAAPLDGEVPRYLVAGIALFEMVKDDLLPIKPIGLQLSQGETATPIFTPEDGFNWEIAKACFEAADFIIHEVVSHLGCTHLVLEGPMVALHRQLPKEHPIHVLLGPHMEGTAFINWGAQELLVVKDGGVDRLQANKIEDTWAMALEQVLARISKDFSPEVDFKARRVTKEDFPGRYPYRDSGLKYWEATHTWVKEYLDIYYKSEYDVSGDFELQAFVDELVHVGKMRWLEDYAGSKNKKALIAKVLASLVYTASTLHAAVNFPQQSRTSFVPNTPGSIYAPPPTDKEERSLKDYLAYLPPIEIATSQVVLSTLLGSVYHTKLGDYETRQFSDKRVRKPLAKFQETLENIEADMIDENAFVVAAWRKRGKDKKDAANFGYTTLLPDNIPQSINI